LTAFRADRPVFGIRCALSISPTFAGRSESHFAAEIAGAVPGADAPLIMSLMDLAPTSSWKGRAVGSIIHPILFSE
jgi:hypothetical protein